MGFEPYTFKDEEGELYILVISSMKRLDKTDRFGCLQVIGFRN